MIQTELPTEFVEPLLRLMAEYPQVAAAISAFLASWVLYGVIGKQALGADDDYWPKIRGTVLPLLDTVAAGTIFYAEADNYDRELVGVVPANIDDVERGLEDAG